MLEGKKVFVVMPAYNAARTLNQTFRELPHSFQNLLLRFKLSEYHSGYRAFSRQVLNSLPLEENSDDFVFDNEMLAQVSYKQYPVGEISCPTKYLILRAIAGLAILAAIMGSAPHIEAQNEGQPVDDMTAKYHFLSADDTLAILDEEGRLKGYIEVAQPEEESDDILTYDIQEGSRNKNHVQFRTNRIHGKYYRFSGTVERGKGHLEKDPDYFRLTGDVDIVTVKMETSKEAVQTVRVTLKSFGKSERPDD